MKFDFDASDQTIPTLEEFKLMVAKQVLLNSFFQEEKKQDFDMLR